MNPFAVGPLIDKAGFEKVQRHVLDALSRGGRACSAESAAEGDLNKGFFFQPTVLAQINTEMLVMQEETFGPVLPFYLSRAKTKSSPPPIACRRDWQRIFIRATQRTRSTARRETAVRHRRCERLAAGAPHVPFGGIKQSGIGKEGGRLGLEEFLDTKLSRWQGKGRARLLPSRGPPMSGSAGASPSQD